MTYRPTARTRWSLSSRRQEVRRRWSRFSGSWAADYPHGNGSLQADVFRDGAPLAPAAAVRAPARLVDVALRRTLALRQTRAAPPAWPRVAGAVGGRPAPGLP